MSLAQKSTLAKNLSKAKLEACTSAVTAMHTELFPTWHGDGYLHSAIGGLELGDQCQNAHIQFGVVILTAEPLTSTDDPKAIRELDRKLRPWLNNNHTREGRVKWALRQVRTPPNEPSAAPTPELTP